MIKNNNYKKGFFLAGIPYLVVILLILFIFFGIMFGDCSGVDCLLGLVKDPEKKQESVKPDPTAVTASGSVAYKSYTVTAVMTFPIDGGAVTGSFSGACDGSITGSYAGGDGGAISGKGSGTCGVFFPTSGTFSGSVNKTSRTVPIAVSGKAAGKAGGVSMTLAY